MKTNFYIKQLVVLFLFSVLITGKLFAQPADIVYVYDPGVIDATTGENPDVPMMRLLEEQGYTVFPFTTFNLSTATEEQLDSLNNADLVYAGRAIGSTNFADANKALWHAIQAPVITSNMWALRSNRMNWYESETCENINDTTSVVTAEIIEIDDIVFDGVETPLEWWTGNYSQIIAEGGNGEVLATNIDNGAILFERFESYEEFYPGSVDMPEGERVFFGSAGDEATDADGNKIYNYLGFTEPVKQIFLNEIARLTGTLKVGVDNKPELSISVYPNPAVDQITVEMANMAKVEILDLTGKQIRTIEANVERLTFDVSDLNAGIYLIKVSDINNGAISKKVTIK